MRNLSCSILALDKIRERSGHAGVAKKTPDGLRGSLNSMVAPGHEDGGTNSRRKGRNGLVCAWSLCQRIQQGSHKGANGTFYQPWKTGVILTCAKKKNDGGTWKTKLLKVYSTSGIQ